MSIEERFVHHPPKNQERIEAHENTRASVLQLAIQLDSDLPDGREKSLAITKLEEALFWANAAIARQDV